MECPLACCHMLLDEPFRKLDEASIIAGIVALRVHILTYGKRQCD